MSSESGMAGLEVLYACVAENVSCPHDAVVCFVHWNMIKSGFRCLGSGDESLSSDKMSELLPTGWSSNKDVYSLRYKATGDEALLLLKAIAVQSTLIFNVMNLRTQHVSELTVDVKDHVDADHLHTFERVFKDAESLSEKVRAQLLPSVDPPARQRAEPRSQREGEQQGQRGETSTRHPFHGADWPEPSIPPFEAGGADLDPFGCRGGGGMIVDPLRTGYPRSGFHPSSGIPDVLPRGAVPPGARFDPFGPIGQGGAGVNPDHLLPPGFEDSFM
ncbi:proteasome inhibitor PI31 subunit [Brachionichthys hirsutus]|uniref:proteasome inhibitor PI31 subunit n=1 Tax=Brachionichthys hirsutus TaxID=412623 RepID=UPI003604345C